LTWSHTYKDKTVYLEKYLGNNGLTDTIELPTIPSADAIDCPIPSAKGDSSVAWYSSDTLKIWRDPTSEGLTYAPDAASNADISITESSGSGGTTLYTLNIDLSSVAQAQPIKFYVMTPTNHKYETSYYVQKYAIAVQCKV
jgi:hypothetical protein